MKDYEINLKIFFFYVALKRLWISIKLNAQDDDDSTTAVEKVPQLVPGVTLRISYIQYNDIYNLLKF